MPFFDAKTRNGIAATVPQAGSSRRRHQNEAEFAAIARCGGRRRIGGTDLTA
jgi:hypothetical protein